MKKLIKTAKQQFEERLSELEIVSRWEMCPTEIYYHCESPNGLFILLRDQDGEYKELQYGMSYVDFVMTESFLSSVVERFNQGEVPIRPLFDWYASADHDNEPFNYLDVYMSELEDSHFTFEDIYEEVPDVQIISAQEQWKKDSDGSTTISLLANGSVYKMKSSKESTDFYIHQDGGKYTKNSTCSLEELRKNGEFMSNYLNIVMDMHPEDMEYAIKWLKTGVYEMCEVSLMDIYEAIPDRFFNIVEYEDKETAPIGKMDFSTEITGLKERMIAHIKELYEQGMELDSDSFLRNAYSITWSDGSYYVCENLESCKLAKSDEGVLCFCETETNDKDVTYDSPLSTLTINTLWSIIDAMH